MELKKTRYGRALTRMTATACIISFLSVGAVWAKGPGGPGSGPSPGFGGPGNRPVKALPPGAGPVHYHGKDFWFNRGAFYQHGPGGFRPVRPPRGLVVGYLPPGFETMVFAGLTYFLFAGTYYKQVPTGYMVVEKPVVVNTSPQQPIFTNGQVLLVDAFTLNVRSGPGTNNPVIFQVSQGDQLRVQGTAPGWYYVQLPNGSTGWVMAKYTRTMPTPAQG